MGADGTRAAADRLRSALDPAAGGELEMPIATLRRSEREELRVSVLEWKGQRLVSVRLWRNTRGRWFPDPRRGLTVRVAELPDFLDALAAAADSITADLASRAPSQPDGKGP